MEDIIDAERNLNQLEDVNGGTGDRYVRYTVVSGAAITRIARRFGTSAQTILELNPIINLTLI